MCIRSHNFGYRGDTCTIAVWLPVVAAIHGKLIQAVHKTWTSSSVLYRV